MCVIIGRLPGGSGNRHFQEGAWNTASTAIAPIWEGFRNPQGHRRRDNGLVRLSLSPARPVLPTATHTHTRKVESGCRQGPLTLQCRSGNNGCRPREPVAADTAAGPVPVTVPSTPFRREHSPFSPTRIILADAVQPQGAQPAGIRQPKEGILAVPSRARPGAGFGKSSRANQTALLSIAATGGQAS